MATSDSIHVTIGIGDEVNHMPLEFYIEDDWTGFAFDYTYNDLTIAHAVIMDLADAIVKKIAEKVN